MVFFEKLGSVGGLAQLGNVGYLIPFLKIIEII